MNVCGGENPIVLLSSLVIHPLILDLDEGRLKVAKEMGATHTIKVATKNSRALAREIETTLGCKPDRSFECSGAESSIAAAIYVRK